MKKKRQLNRLLEIREIQCRQVMVSLSEEEGRLQLEEQRLNQLETYQKTYEWQEGTHIDGLALTTAQMMSVTVDRAVRHQKQQVAVQQVQCRSARDSYIQEKRQVSTTEMLVEKHNRVLEKKSSKAEQKQMDEFAMRSVQMS